MIKNKKLGLEIFENEDERMWVNAFEAQNRLVEQLKEALKITKKDRKDTDRKIVKKVREGMKKQEKEYKQSLKFHKELLKFYGTKLNESNINL